MRQALTLIAFSSIFIFCGREAKLSTGRHTKQITTANIKGNWYLNKWTTYHTLIIGDSTIFVDHNIDTIFTLHYSVYNDTLKTWATGTHKIFKNKIVELTNENLILEGIAEVDERRTYSRIKTAFKNE